MITCAPVSSSVRSSCTWSGYGVVGA
jgi:hypothetical protein